MLLLYLLLPLLMACGEYDEGPMGITGHDGGGAVSSGPKSYPKGPAKPGVGPKTNDAYPEGPKQTPQKGKAHRVQDQAPCTLCFNAQKWGCEKIAT
ncbi:hypothetical protein PRIPAC_80289 [Pristionchus pacificus]|uniref:Uncharacterized protein n=1 Tax=Pristionchus pacificus TaxID=54126 RepID=A0A2A6CKD0_PRIPA|nr:hypothetical protein PRIPAC_80289 [Pristionchus pacificus]|eukprot:PDM78579.1 hypothetical protein PRIPAC_31158 [Pristionchus pacificus]